MAPKSIFEWDKTKYTTYVSAMDKEHEKLVAIMNRLYQENDQGVPKAQLLKTVDELAKYTTQHFASEEAYFMKIPNYKSADTHKRIHENLLKDFGAHVEKFKKSSENKVPNDFFMFLKVWLSAHICGIDRKYGEITKAG